MRGIIFEDVADDEKEGLNLEYPVPSYTTLEVHSPASAAPASNFPSRTKSSSGIIFNVYFSLFLLLKISKPFLPGVMLSHCCYTECYVMPVSSEKSVVSLSRLRCLLWLHGCAFTMSSYCT